MPTSITLVATSTSASPAANERMASCFSAVGIWPWISATRWSRNSVLCRRSASTVAARACSASDSETSGHTTKHWRPAAISSRMRSYARERARGAVHHMGLHRPAPRGQLAQHRGLEVAVRGEGQRARDRRGGHVQHVRATAPPAPWRRARRAGARRSGAARPPRTRPGRGTARRPRSARACPPPATARPSPAARAARGGGPAGVEPVSSSTGARPPSRRSRVIRCCSASVSVGAIRAAWRPFSTARSIAPTATSVFPTAHLPHQQALHRAGRRRGRSRSARVAARWSPVGSKGRPSSHGSTSSPVGSSGARAAGVAPRAPPPHHGHLGEEQLLEGQAAARLRPRRPRCRGSGRRPARRGGRAAARPPATPWAAARRRGASARSWPTASCAGSAADRP